IDSRSHRSELAALQLPRASIFQCHPAGLWLIADPATSLGEWRVADSAEAPSLSVPQNELYHRTPRRLHAVSLPRFARCCECRPPADPCVVLGRGLANRLASPDGAALLLALRA